MLLAAMILGIVGGVTYFAGGISAVTSVSWEQIFETHTGPPWWTVILIPIGLVGLFGGVLVYWKPKAGAILLALASVSALAAGIASYQQSSQLVQLEGVSFVPPILPTHPFATPLLYLPGPLLALTVGAALAFAAMKRPGIKSVGQISQSKPGQAGGEDSGPASVAQDTASSTQ